MENAFRSVICMIKSSFYRSLLVKTIFLFGSFFLNTFSFADNFYEQYQERADAIVANMTTEEKIGQMVLPTFTFITKNKSPDAVAEAQAAWFVETNLVKLGKICGFDAIAKYHLGAVLQDAGPLIYSGDDQSLAQWQKVSTMANLFYTGPPGTHLLLGTDAVHGDQHVTGTILFPHNIGVGATHNPDLAEKIGFWTKRNVQTTGFNWAYAPTVAVGHDYRWGRLYESYGSNVSVLKALSAHFITGIQAIVDNKFMSGILATPKHFISDGDTKKGIDQGYSYSKSLEQCWRENGAGYEAAVDESAGSIMASYNSLNNIPMHFGGAFNILQRFLTKGIRGSNGKIYRFPGFVVSDYVGVSKAAYKCLIKNNTCGLLHCNEKLDGCCGCQGIFKRTCHEQCASSSQEVVSIFDLYVRAVAKAVNAGVDMLMVAYSSAYVNPLDYDPSPPYTTLSPAYYNKIGTVVRAIEAAVNQGLISEERFNEAVSRIIRVKLSMSPSPMIPLSPEELIEEAKISLQSAEQSLVLLKNEEHTLPIYPNTIKHVFLMGTFDDIGSQNGGWTVTWQGQKGNTYWPAGSVEKTTSFATSILDGIRAILGHSPHYYKGEDVVLSANLKGVTSHNSVAIIALAESPYAEYNGDIDNGNPFYIKGALTGQNIYNSPIQPTFLGTHFTNAQMDAIKHLQKNGVKIVAVLFSGRPIVITEGKCAPLNHSDAFIAAFLPGTSGGQAIANAIFGKYGFKSVKSSIKKKIYSSNTLPFAWPNSMKEVRHQDPTLFPTGYGLKTQPF